MKRGNCYVTSEALFHLLGGKAAGWKPMMIPKEHAGGKDAHWFLVNTITGQRLDATSSQFTMSQRPYYEHARGCGFLTKQPSKRAQALMQTMVWQ